MKEFKVGDVVTSLSGVGVIEEVTDTGMVCVLFENGSNEDFELDGKMFPREPVALFHGKGKVDITFTPEPVYEYMWRVDYENGWIRHTGYYKTKKEARKHAPHYGFFGEVVSFKRVKESKRIAME